MDQVDAGEWDVTALLAELDGQLPELRSSERAFVAGAGAAVRCSSNDPLLYSSVMERQGSGRRALGYVRVSTAEQADQGVSLEAQERLLTEAADARGWEIEIVVDAAVSGAKNEDAGLGEALRSLDAGHHDALMVVRLDRLTRSVSGLARILERAQSGSWDLVILKPVIDTTDPTGRFTGAILASAAQYERDLIGQRTREALAHRRSQGVRLGRRSGVSPDLLERIQARREQKASLRTIAEELNAEGVPTAQGGRKWHASTISALLKADAASKG